MPSSAKRPSSWATNSWMPMPLGATRTLRILPPNGTYGQDTIPPLARSVRPGGPDLAPELHGVLELDAGEAGLHGEEVELALLELARAVEGGAHHVGGVLEPCAVELHKLGGHGTSFRGSAGL